MNTFGTLYRLTTFGESHGPALGGVIDGVPSGVKIDLDEVQRELDRRRPGQSAIVTQRNEADRVEFLSGLLDDVTLGTPVGFIIRNREQRSADYDEMRHLFRPSHADYTYQCRYGIRDHRGGGRASARETASRVVAGAVARQILRARGVEIVAYTAQVGSVCLPERYPQGVTREMVEANAVRCPDAVVAGQMERLILDVKAQGDTVGGIVECIVTGLPAGVGEPVFGKLQAMLAGAMMSIPAAKGFDYGMGFDGASRLGSEMIDEFVTDSTTGTIKTRTNNSGGIQGGITNGMPVTFRVAFKPVATLLLPVPTVDDQGHAAILHARGRHDPCVVARAVPVVEAMAAMTVLDALLMCR